MRKMYKKILLIVLTMLLVFSMSMVSSAASVKINKKSVTLYVTKTTTLKVTGTKKKVKWSSSNKKIAKVSSKGKVTAVKAGKATITATVGKKSYKCKVTVKNGLNKKEVTLAPGKSTTLKLYGTKIKSVKTSKKSVATISKKGKITAKKAGKCKITITGKDKKKYTCTVTVVQNVKSLTLNKTTTSLKTGESEQLTVTAAPDNATNKKATWSSSNSAVASVDANGKVTAVKAGTAVITATAADGSGKSASCTVTVVQPATGVSLDQTAAELKTGESVTLKATVAPTDATNAAVTWSSSNSAVASVDANGKVTAVKAGTAVITATTADGSTKTASCTVTVIQKAASVTVEPKNTTVVEGKTITLKATVLPADTTNPAVTWNSSNTAVATVDASGVVTAIDPGKAEIKATTADGTSLAAVCAVTVEDDGVQEAATQTELDAALKMNVHTITIQTDNAVSLNIPAGDYTDKKLVVNAPNGEVTNAANWKEIELQAIADHSYVEKASGNSISFKAMSGRVEVAEGARTSIQVSGATRGQKLTLENFGTISDMVLSNVADIKVTGSATSRAIPITSAPAAAGSSINTSQNLRLNAQSPISLILQPGAENTTATVNNDANRPQVSGLGSVTVTNTNTNEIDTIVADASSSVTAKTVTVTGVVDAAADNAPIAGASVYLIPYNASINPDQIANYYQTANVKKVQTASDGSYKFTDAALGNYYLAVTASGYATNIQTLVITSITSDTYNNATVFMIKANDNTPGKITGTLYDALTGDAIDYPVVLKVRRGQNNLSGTALKTVNVAGESKGYYTVADLTPGAYTLQVLSASGSDEKIMNTSFNVTVIPGETMEVNFTVTRQLHADSQVRFVLTWGTQESGAPSDLDSHLTGPAANGNERFHTYYSNEEYIYNGVRYADLDVDDVSWEGPETTTIYQAENGIYSFYVFDFTDQEDEYSTNMSNNSKAIVNVYKGEVLIGTFYVPTGQSGNLWHVCEYNAVNGVLTGVNTIGYWPDGGSSTVGMSMIDVLRNRIGERLDELDYYVELMADCTYKTQLKAALDSARSVYNSSDDETTLQNTLKVLDEYLSVVRTVPSMVISGTNVEEYEQYDTSIRVYGTEAELGEITVGVDNTEDEIDYTVSYQSVSDQDYVGIITVTRADIGLTRIWYVYYTFNVYVFNVRDVTGEGITDFYLSYDEDDNRVLRLFGTTPEMPEFTLQVNDKISYTVEEDPNGIYDAVIHMKYDNKEEYTATYYVKYWLDSSMFRISGVSGNGITDYDAERYQYEGELYLYGYADSLPDFTITVKDGVSWTKEVDDDGRCVLNLSFGGYQYCYYVHYEFDESDFEINNITGAEISGWEQRGNIITLRGTAATLPEFEVEVLEGADVKIQRDAADPNHATITVTYNSYSWSMEVYYIWNYRVFDIASVSGGNILSYTYTNNEDGDNTLVLVGTSDAVDLTEITVTAKEEMNITVTAENDDTTDVIGYVNMKLDDEHSATYAVYYEKTEILTCNTEYQVEVTEQKPTKSFIFIPETEGYYSFESTGSDDTYCTLYDSDGIMLRTADDKNDDEDYNFELGYQLYAGETYVYVVREYDKGAASFKVKLTLVEEVIEEVEVTPIEELLVAEELLLDLTSGEITELTAAPETESEQAESETSAAESETAEEDVVTEEILLAEETEVVSVNETENVVQEELLADVTEELELVEVTDEELELIQEEEVLE